jgi:hypothetical protein
MDKREESETREACGIARNKTLFCHFVKVQFFAKALEYLSWRETTLRKEFKVLRENIKINNYFRERFFGYENFRDYFRK